MGAKCGGVDGAAGRGRGVVVDAGERVSSSSRDWNAGSDVDVPVPSVVAADVVVVVVA